MNLIIFYKQLNIIFHLIFNTKWMNIESQL